MIYGNSVDQIRGMIDDKIAVFRLAKVTSYNNGRAHVQIYGDTQASGKDYPVLKGYEPRVGDDVLMCVQGSTMIIAGKIVKDALTDSNLYLTKSAAASTYITEAAADNKYALKPVYELERESYRFTMDSSGHLTGSSSNVTLGASANSPFGAIYTTGITLTGGGDLVASASGTNLGSTSQALGTAYINGITLSGTGCNITPASDNVAVLGTSSKEFKEAYIKTVHSDSVGTSSDKVGNGYFTTVNATTVSATDVKGTNVGTSSSHFTTGYINTVNATTVYATNVGTSSSKITDIYATNLHTDSFTPTNIGSSGSKVTNGYFSNLYPTHIGTVNSKTTDAYITDLYATNIGTSSSKVTNAYITNLYPSYIGSSTNRVSSAYFSQIGDGNSSSNGRVADAYFANVHVYTSIQAHWSGSSNINIGSSGQKFNNVYANQYYQNGTAISTSDKRKKTGIKNLTKKYVEFFKRLRPRSFKFKDGESGRTHTGFIAQEVEEAAQEVGIDNKDLAFICIDENGDYGLRYEELIAIQTQVIQDLQARVEELERRMA